MSLGMMIFLVSIQLSPVIISSAAITALLVVQIVTSSEILTYFQWQVLQDQGKVTNRNQAENVIQPHRHQYSQHKII